jgi:hypothetical protein
MQNSYFFSFVICNCDQGTESAMWRLSLLGHAESKGVSRESELVRESRCLFSTSCLLHRL